MNSLSDTWNSMKWSNVSVIEVLEEKGAEKIFEEKMRNRNILF